MSIASSRLLNDESSGDTLDIEDTELRNGILTQFVIVAESEKRSSTSCWQNILKLFSRLKGGKFQRLRTQDEVCFVFR